jgi:oligoribonuclease NrnB/cAMP/cGMP phosphodiesterase (DHH superfamily)
VTVFGRLASAAIRVGEGDLDVQEICKKHFNGGGHKNGS